MYIYIFVFVYVGVDRALQSRGHGPSHPLLAAPRLGDDGFPPLASRLGIYIHKYVCIFIYTYRYISPASLETRYKYIYICLYIYIYI
jgi:hypothetical protein